MERIGMAICAVIVCVFGLAIAGVIGLFAYVIIAGLFAAL